VGLAPAGRSAAPAGDPGRELPGKTKKNNRDRQLTSGSLS